MNIQYRIIKNIFKYLGTKKFYEINIPNKRTVNYSDENDVSKGNETSEILNSSPRKYFEWFDNNLSEKVLDGKVVLDLGSGFGGRTIYYAKCCRCRMCYGIDVDEQGLSEAKKYADYIKVENIKFDIGSGEDLPYEDNLFDLVLSYDVLEHVNDVERVFSEVYRVLKPSGKFCSVFPPYYGPNAHHLKRTNVPWMNVIFSTEKIYEVLRKEYGDDFELWKHKGKVLREGLNGTTVKEYKSYVRNSKFKVKYQKFAPLLSKQTEIYNGISNNLLREILRMFFAMTPKLPFLKEYFTHRIVFILEK